MTFTALCLENQVQEINKHKMLNSRKIKKLLEKLNEDILKTNSIWEQHGGLQAVQNPLKIFQLESQRKFLSKKFSNSHTNYQGEKPGKVVLVSICPIFIGVWRTFVVVDKG